MFAYWWSWSRWWYTWWKWCWWWCVQRGLPPAVESLYSSSSRVMCKIQLGFYFWLMIIIIFWGWSLFSRQIQTKTLILLVSKIGIVKQLVTNALLEMFIIKSEMANISTMSTTVILILVMMMMMIMMLATLGRWWCRWRVMQHSEGGEAPWGQVLPLRPLLVATSASLIGII